MKSGIEVAFDRLVEIVNKIIIVVNNFSESIHQVSKKCSEQLMINFRAIFKAKLNFTLPLLLVILSQ